MIHDLVGIPVCVLEGFPDLSSSPFILNKHHSMSHKSLDLLLLLRQRGKRKRALTWLTSLYFDFKRLYVISLHADIFNVFTFLTLASKWAIKTYSVGIYSCSMEGKYSLVVFRLCLQVSTVQDTAIYVSTISVVKEWKQWGGGGHCNLGQPVLLYLNYACPDSNEVKPKRAVLKF